MYENGINLPVGFGQMELGSAARWLWANGCKWNHPTMSWNPTPGSGRKPINQPQFYQTCIEFNHPQEFIKVPGLRFWLYPRKPLASNPWSRPRSNVQTRPSLDLSCRSPLLVSCCNVPISSPCWSSSCTRQRRFFRSGSNHQNFTIKITSRGIVIWENDTKPPVFTAQNVLGLLMLLKCPPETHFYPAKILKKGQEFKFWAHNKDPAGPAKMLQCCYNIWREQLFGQVDFQQLHQFLKQPKHSLHLTPDTPAWNSSFWSSMHFISCGLIST